MKTDGIRILKALCHAGLAVAGERNPPTERKFKVSSRLWFRPWYSLNKTLDLGYGSKV